MNGPHFQFEWDEGKAAANMRKHGIPFDLARTVFSDANLLTVADLDHSAILPLVYLWFDAAAETTTVRLIPAPQYREGG